jgi:hypothetical protein
VRPEGGIILDASAIHLNSTQLKLDPAPDKLAMPVIVPGWCDHGDRTVGISSDTAVWRHARLPVVSLHWVLLCDHSQRFDPQALLCNVLCRAA